MVLDATLLNTQHYKVYIKGKVEQSRERRTALLTLWCRSYWKWSFRVTLDYGRQQQQQENVVRRKKALKKTKARKTRTIKEVNWKPEPTRKRDNHLPKNQNRQNHRPLNAPLRTQLGRYKITHQIFWKELWIHKKILKNFIQNVYRTKNQKLETWVNLFNQRKVAFSNAIKSKKNKKKKQQEFTRTS